MFKLKSLAFVVSLILLGISLPAQAQTVTRLCTQIKSTASGVTIYSCPDVNTSNPLPVTSMPVSSAQTPLLNGSTTVTGTTVSTVFPPPGAGSGIYISSAQFSNSGSATSQAQIVAGVSNTSLATISVPASPAVQPLVTFAIPLAAAANTSVGCIWSAASTSNTCSLQGYVAPR